MATLDLFIIRKTKQAVTSLTDPTPLVLPEMEQGDTMSLSVTVLDQIAPIGSPGAIFQRVDPASYTLRAGLFQKVASTKTTLSSVLAGAFAIDPVAQRQVAILALNTAPIDAAISTANGDVSNIMFEIEMTETATAAITTILHYRTVTLVEDYLSNALGAVAGSKTAASQAFVQNGFEPKIWTDTTTKIIKTVGGLYFKLTYDDDGNVIREPYIPPP